MRQVDDLVAFACDAQRRSRPGTAFFLGGHSMGALAALHAALRNQLPWHGLVLGTATVDVEWTPLLRAQALVGGLLAAVVPRARIVPAVKGEHMSDDPAAIEDIVADPLNAMGNMRARTANELLRAFRGVSRRAHELALPLYAHHGREDHLASLAAVKHLLRTAASRDVTLVEVEGGYHELFMSSHREALTYRIAAWMLARAHDMRPSI